jgi:hypothetical protein
MDVIAPIVALAVLVSLACWSRVIARWRDPDGPDDDDPWRHGGGHRPVQAGELPEPVRGLSQSSARH